MIFTFVYFCLLCLPHDLPSHTHLFSLSLSLSPEAAQSDQKRILTFRLISDPLMTQSPEAATGISHSRAPCVKFRGPGTSSILWNDFSAAH